VTGNLNVCKKKSGISTALRKLNKIIIKEKKQQIYALILKSVTVGVGVNNISFSLSKSYFYTATNFNNGYKQQRGEGGANGSVARVFQEFKKC
jgi:hypothetical protein